jgi:hypothetical protein
VKETWAEAPAQADSSRPALQIFSGRLDSLGGWNMDAISCAAKDMDALKK